MKKNTRRRFVKRLASASAGVAVLGSSSNLLASSFSQIIGANERIRVGVIGCGGMANGHMKAILKMKESDNIEIAAVCDV